MVLSERGRFSIISSRLDLQNTQAETQAALALTSIRGPRIPIPSEFVESGLSSLKEAGATGSTTELPWWSDLYHNRRSRTVPSPIMRAMTGLPNTITTDRYGNGCYDAQYATKYDEKAKNPYR